MLGLDHHVLLHAPHHHLAPGPPLLGVAQPQQPEVGPHAHHDPSSLLLGLHHQPAAGHLPHVPGHGQPLPSDSPQDDPVLAAGDELLLGLPADVPHRHLVLVTLERGGRGGEAVRPPEVSQGGGRVDSEEEGGGLTESQADQGTPWPRLRGSEQ